MDILGQSSLLVAVTAFALGFSVLARNVKNKLFISFAILCTLISAWALSFFLEKISGTGNFYRLHLLSNIWLAPAGLAFIRVMVRIQDGFSRRLLELSILAALSLSVALGLGYENIPWVRLLINFLPTFIAIQTLELMWIDRTLRRGIKRLPKLPTVGFGRRNSIYLGALLVMSTSVMDHVPELGNAIPSAGNLLLTVYLFFLSQAISQQRLLNIGGLFSRFVVLMAVALTLAGVYSLLVAWISNNPWLFLLNSFIASFLILMLLDPLRALVRWSTQRLLTQKYLRLENTLREAQRRLTGVVDPGSLFQEVLMTVEQTLQPEWAALFVLKSDGTKYRRVRLVGIEPEGLQPLREIISNHALLQHCERLFRRTELPVLLDQVLENEVDRSASRAQQEYFKGLMEGLKALRCNLLIPLFDSGQILGFVTLYAPTPPEAWGSNWGLLHVIYPFFEQAARTLRNMEVYVRQREKERLAALGEMAAGLAHEIRNPLGAIKGAAQFLDPTADKPESRFLRVIVEEADRLNRVVTQFLDYSKPPMAEMKSVDLNQLTQRTVETMRPGLKPGVRLDFNAASGGEARAMIAPEQIHQVLLNLIQNAMNALDARGGGRIKVGVDRDDADVVVTVEDDGPGIKRENLEKIFIPFFTTSPGGTGLGLPICQKIIESHRGRFEVQSEENSFTRFSIYLKGQLKGAEA